MKIKYSSSTPDSALPMPAVPITQRLNSTLMMNRYDRMARSNTATQGPHNKPENQGPYLDKSPAPRSG